MIFDHDPQSARIVFGQRLTFFPTSSELWGETTPIRAITKWLPDSALL